MSILRDLGGAASPMNAFQFLQGLETLPLRIREHSRNGQSVAEFLDNHDKVSKVIYPSLQSGESKARADAALKSGYSGLVGFELAGIEAGKKFIDGLELHYQVANIVYVRSLAIHPLYNS